MLGRKQNNILIVKTDGLTAFVAADAAFEAIRNAHPKAKISLLTTPGLQRIARASPYFDQVAAMPNLKDAEARKEFIRQLKTSKFEQVYDLSGNDPARRLKSALGLFGPKWFSAEPAGKPSKGGQQETPSFEKLAMNAGLSIENKLPNLSWAVTARKDSANMQPSWYGISGTFGLLLPGEPDASRWSAAGYAGLAREMSQAGIMPVLAGSKSLHHFGDEIAHEAPQLVDLTGKTDHLQLAALAQEAAFFVSDCAEELQLALSVGCEGVVICSAKQPFSAEGRHIVTMTAPQDKSGAGLADVDPAFVWRTLNNMGLINHGHGAAMTAQIR
ncbi:glycosyltransferase family 9 protein [Hyphococcus sp.]|uniref:glycosyltransferase family 9 protein n=1 Tax=Hyphococcus sp. TaxID=2038636 RepID=UPI0020855AE9|nr:MAG: glycosyl transferase [Marinicaulis sp.]